MAFPPCLCYFPRRFALRRETIARLAQGFRTQKENADRLPKLSDNLPQTRLKHADDWLAAKTRAFERRVAAETRDGPLSTRALVRVGESV